jgi:hypothetical protein
MPDFAILFTKTLLVAAVAAGGAALLVAGGKRASARRVSLGWLLGLAAGFYAGSAVLDQWPRWPAREDRDRLLVVLLPLVLAVESLAALFPAPRHVWAARVGVALAAAPILLFQTVYLADLSGPNSAQWQPGEAVLTLSALAAMLLGVWSMLARLESRTSAAETSAMLVCGALAAGITVMLSGYYRGGALGFPLAGAMLGAALALACLPRAATRPDLGVGLVGIFSLLVVGHYFGALDARLALGIWFAPLLSWAGELPGARRLRPAARSALRIGLVAVPMILIVLWAHARFTEAMGKTSAPRQTQLETR